MGIFNIFQGSPDVENLKAKKDVEGLLLALSYGDRRKKKENEDWREVEAEVVMVELSSAKALAELGENRAIPIFVDRIFKKHGHLVNFSIYDQNPWNSYSSILAQFGEPAVETLLKMLKHEIYYIVCIAEFALGHIGTKANKAVPLLMSLAGDIDNNVAAQNINAIWALGRITNSPEVVPVMIKAILNFSDPIKKQAVRVLGSGQYGKIAADALSVLLERKEELEPWKFYYVILALCLMGDKRGLEAYFLLFVNPHPHKKILDKEILAVIGRFNDGRVRQLLRNVMNDSIKEMEDLKHTYQQVALDCAIHAAIGLTEQDDVSAASFLMESLAVYDLTIFSNWVWEEHDDMLAIRALEKSENVACQSLKELCSRKGDAWVEKWFAECAGLGKIELIRLLIKCGVSLDSRYTDGAPALAMASLNGKLESVRILVEAGSKVDLPDKNGFTAFMLACAKGYLEIANFLIAAGANPLTRDTDGWTALKLALKFNHTDVVELLRSIGVNE
jgi:hypothetical protein